MHLYMGTEQPMTRDSPNLGVHAPWWDSWKEMLLL